MNARLPDDRPVFCLTLDMEWTGEDCLGEVFSLLTERECPFTVFVTHRSAVLDSLCRDYGRIHLGLHPNFLPGSTHGESEDEVIEHCFSLVPGADCFRSHAFHENTGILRKMIDRGIRYDSNLCLYLQPGLVPLRHATGLVRFPIFWEDDIHFGMKKASWDLKDYLQAFSSPGLKVLNFHPMNIALNVPDDMFYRRVKAELGDRWQKATTGSLRDLSWTGTGTRDFLLQILDYIECNNLEPVNLRKINEMYLPE